MFWNEKGVWTKVSHTGPVTYEQVSKDAEIKAYIKQGDAVLAEVGYTEHSFAHVGRAAVVASSILRELDYDERTCELASIAGYMHDIGNMINRVGHAQNGALLAFQILTRMGMDPKEIAQVVSAIGHHDESSAAPVNELAAALLLADKSDVRRSRVRNRNDRTVIDRDIHDRVNFAVHGTKLSVRKEEKTIYLNMEIDIEICPVMDYFEIFLGRMLLCRRAADFLGLSFALIINGSRLL